MPYEAFALFEVEDAPRGHPPGVGRKVGRNDPCPCGSGKKYKKCHLPREQAERASRRESARDHDLDGELVRELGEYATLRFGSEWWHFNEDFVDPQEALQLVIPWSVYQYRVQGQSVLEWYLEEHGRHLSRAERSWLAAQQAAWLSVWEVIGVEPGETLTLRDLLSHRGALRPRGERLQHPRGAGRAAGAGRRSRGGVAAVRRASASASARRRCRGRAPRPGSAAAQAGRARGAASR